MSQTIITEYFTNFYDKNKNDKYCFNSQDIKNKIKKCEDKGFYLYSEKIDKEIGFINILLGIGGQLIFTKDNFYIIDNEESGAFLVNILEYSFVDFKFINGKPKTGGNLFFVKEHEIGFLNFKEKRVSRLLFRDNDFFDLISLIQRELPDVIQKQLEEDKRVREIKRIKQEEHNLVETNKIIEKRRIIDENKRRKEELEKERIIKHEENIRREEELEKERIIKHEENKLSVISELDKDSNNEVDLVDDENYNKILVNNQKNIIEIDKNYIQKFVKISMYLKTKRSNIQNIFITIKDTKNEKDLNELVNLLKNQIHTYDLLVFHSISMVTSLVDSDLITFYQIYECFDQLGVFNSNWENEVSDKLTNIGNGIKDLMYSIYQMENKIVNSIGKLTYITQSSYNNLNLSINNQLRNINSSLDYSNYMTKIQNYKMFDIIT